MNEAETWPPISGLPAKRRMIPAKKLKWGQSPFDDLNRAELLRLVQAYHSALTSCASCLNMAKQLNETSAYWGVDGSGGRALAKADYLMALSGDGTMDGNSEKIYRLFFRYADALLFGTNDDFRRWGVRESDKTMTAPFNPDEGYRALEWRDLHPSAV